MTPVRFDPETHLSEVNRWLQARGLQPFPLAMLSQTGYYVDGVAVCFLYLTDSSVALLDACTANPDAPAKARHEAIRSIVEELVREAKRRGCTHVVGYTAVRGLVSALKRLGFSVGPDRNEVLVRALA